MNHKFNEIIQNGHQPTETCVLKAN